MISLQLDAVVANGAARAKIGLELFEHGGQIARAGIETADDRDHLAAAAALAADACGLIFWEEQFAARIARAFALLQRLAAAFAGDRTFKRSSIEETGHNQIDSLSS